MRDPIALDPYCPLAAQLPIGVTGLPGLAAPDFWNPPDSFTAGAEMQGPAGMGPGPGPGPVMFAPLDWQRRRVSCFQCSVRAYPKEPGSPNRAQYTPNSPYSGQIAML